MQIKIRYQNTDKFCLAVGKDAGDLVFFIVKLYQSVGYNLLVLQRERVRIIKVSGYRCFGKMSVLCNIVEGYILFLCHPDASFQFVRCMFRF